MSLDWTHQFCLACDKQTDGATYCSQSCRLADYLKTSSTSSSGQGSPTFNTNGMSQSSFSNAATSRHPLYLSPAYDFKNRRPHATASLATEQLFTPSNRLLSPSNSHTSLSSMRSNSSDSGRLSDNVTRELKAYARSFESVRVQRRRSY